MITYNKKLLAPVETNTKIFRQSSKQQLYLIKSAVTSSNASEYFEHVIHCQSENNRSKFSTIVCRNAQPPFARSAIELINISLLLATLKCWISNAGTSNEMRETQNTRQ